MTIEELARDIAARLPTYTADYLELRLEESQSSQLAYRGRELEGAWRASDSGGAIRAAVKGGWGFASFNSLEGIPGRIEQAISQAALASRGETELAEVAAVSDSVATEYDPVALPLAAKKALLDEYNDIIWATPGIKTSFIRYGDSRKKSIFASSNGSFIEQTRADVSLRLTAVAAKDGDVQQSGLSLGSRGDFGAIEELHQQVEEMAKHAVALLSAPRVKAGEYTVVLDPVLAGVFIHEAFGHLSEADFIYENPPLREIMVLGREFGQPLLNVVDDPALPGLRGSYRYDDEGVPTAKNYLVREGKLVGRLHSRETAAKLGEAPSGNARAVSYRFPPIVRMSNTYIEPGQASFDDLIGDIKEGVYAKNWYGGTTSMEMFTFSSGEAYMIRGGKLAEAVRPVVLSGNVFTTLKSIDGIAGDLEMNQGGGCGKAGQYPLPVSNGSPHIRLQRCLVGGG